MTFPVVVTGASGFIGRHLVAYLRRRGVPVIALSRRADLTDVSGTKIHPVQAYSDFEPVSGAVLVHLAEPPHIASVDAEGERHVARMRDQAAALLSRNYARAIYVSSATVYGDAENEPRRPEEKLPPPSKVYSQAKLAVERVFVRADQIVARVTNVFGHGMAAGTIFADIIRQLGGSGPVTIRETTPVRDYLWVDDAAEALAFMTKGSATGIYNVASGNAVSCEQLTNLVLRFSGQDGRTVVGALPPRHSVLRLDISATTRDFGWLPRTGLQAGIAELLKPGIS